MVIKVEVIGSDPPCSGCVVAGRRVEEVAAKFPGKFVVEKYPISDPRAEKYKVKTVPRVFINGEELKIAGIPTVEQLEEAFREAVEREG